MNEGQRCGAEIGGGLWPPVRLWLSVPAGNEMRIALVREG